jgi:two-component system, NtrC family, response regulator AtoC
MVNLKDSDIFIYIVDEDELLSKIIRTKFEQSGEYKLICFSTAEEFLEYFPKRKFNNSQIHVVLIDYILKSVSGSHNGIQVLKTIKEINKEVEVIILSNIEDIDIATSAIKAGAVSFIKKNENSFLRIQNNVKFIISEKRLKLTRKQSRLTRIIFILLSTLFIIIAILYFLTEY